MSEPSTNRLCFDRPIPWELQPEAARVAIAENPRNAPTTRGVPGHGANPGRLALQTAKLWKPGRTVGVAFLDGSPLQRRKVAEIAAIWSKYANITFKFDAGAKAEIRVSFQADPGSWSALGTDCLVAAWFPADQPSMNFGWLRDDTDDAEWSRVVLHEFGHALGAIHEHQNPLGGIAWNVDAVYKAFSGPPNNWSKADIDFNILQTYSLDQLNATRFDPNSIMLYGFPAEFIQGGTATHNNNELSAADKRMMRRFYP
ncbi:MAG: hypothetical protein ACH37Z_04330 [Anaerolineae bacterium]